jgi:hypothetical protein
VRDRVAYVHVTVAEASAPGTFNVTILLDSLQALESGQPVSPDSVLAARGTHWTATLTSTGGLGLLTADKQGTLPDELTGRLRLLFPALPAGGVREGMEWGDTTEYRLTADAFPGTERAMTTYKARPGDAARRASRSRAQVRTSGPAPRTRRTRSCKCRRPAPAGSHLLGYDGIRVREGNDVGDATITVPRWADRAGAAARPSR